jgi:hypothetical protein
VRFEDREGPKKMLYTRGTAQVNKLGEGDTPQIVDSGAEINTVPIALMLELEDRGYKVEEACITDRVMFGKASNTEEIQAWVVTNSVLGRIAVVDMEVAIVSVAVITTTFATSIELPPPKPTTPLMLLAFANSIASIIRASGGSAITSE